MAKHKEMEVRRRREENLTFRRVTGTEKTKRRMVENLKYVRQTFLCTCSM